MGTTPAKSLKGRHRTAGAGTSRALRLVGRDRELAEVAEVADVSPLTTDPIASVTQPLLQL